MRKAEDAQPAQPDERTDDAQAGAGKGTVVHELTVASASIGHQGPSGDVQPGIPLYTPPAATRGSRQNGSRSDPLDASGGGSKTWLDRLWGMCG